MTKKHRTRRAKFSFRLHRCRSLITLLPLTDLFRSKQNEIFGLRKDRAVLKLEFSLCFLNTAINSGLFNAEFLYWTRTTQSICRIFLNIFLPLLLYRSCHQTNPATCCWSTCSCMLTHSYECFNIYCKYWKGRTVCKCVGSSLLHFIKEVNESTHSLYYLGNKIRGCIIQQATEISVQMRMRNGNALFFALLPAIKSTFPWKAGRLDELQAIFFFPVSYALTFMLRGESVGGERKTKEECLPGCWGLRKNGK